MSASPEFVSATPNGSRPAQPVNLPTGSTLGSDVVIENLSVSYGGFDALRNVSLEVKAGTTMALVGESGSGKSTLALAASRLLPAGAEIVSGTVTVGDTELVSLRDVSLRAARGRVVAYLAQDALAALNPVVRVGNQIAEVFRGRDGLDRSESRERALQALGDMKIADPARVARLYPHQLSGGMRQRVMIAIALAFQPQLLVADEPTTALDVTVQADILRLMSDLQRRTGLTVIWITHDMGVVAEIADSVAVVYGGRLVEIGDVNSAFDNAMQPYTRDLLRCFNDDRTATLKQRFHVIRGNPPVGKVIAGCPYHPRCDLATDICRSEMPKLVAYGDDHLAACHHAGVSE